MMRTRVFPQIIALFFLALLASAQQHATSATNAVAITDEPSHHLIIQNQYVRAFKVEVAPHSATRLHQHDHDYLFVTLGDSKVSNQVAGKPAVTLELKDGETHFVRGGFAHVAENLSAQPFRNITIELLQPVPGEVTTCDISHQPCGMVTGETCAVGGLVQCATTQTMLRSAQFQVKMTTIPSGLSTARHTHAGPHLAVALTDLDLRNDVEGKPSVQIHQKAGDVVWVTGGFTHTLTNLGAHAARLVAIEFQK
jgi:quercetin dioxygenase-like cupin family protein